MLRGRIVDARGQPVVGAELTWTALTRALARREIEWTSSDAESVDAATAHATTDSSGEFQFETHPDVADAIGSVVWVTAPSMRAASRIFAGDSAQFTSTCDLVLESAEPVRARVVDPRGTQVAGATILQRGWFDGLSDQSSAAIEIAAQRAFVRRVDTDANGLGELSRTLGLQFVSARSGALVSRPSRYEPLPDSLEIRLLATFAARGVVRAIDGAVPLGDLTVSCASEDSAARRSIAAVRVGADGSWSLDAIPCYPTEAYRFRLEGRGIAICEESLRSPKPGDRLEVNFAYSRGTSVTLKVVDANSAPIAGARAWAAWRIGFDTRRAIATTDSDGIAIVDGAPIDSVWFGAARAGFRSNQIGPFEVADVGSTPQLVQLARGARVRGRCTHAGNAVEDFELIYWLGDPSTAQHRGFVDRADGSFELDDAPIGKLSITACSGELSQAEIRTVETSSDTAAAVDLVLEDARRVHGRVVDVVDAHPIVDASVQSYSSSGFDWLMPRGAARRVSMDGEFDFVGASRGANCFVVVAPNYLPQYLTLPPSESEIVECGEVALAHEQSLDVVLRSAQPIDFTRFSVESVGSSSFRRTAFTRDGRVRFDRAIPGNHNLAVRGPDDFYAVEYVDLRVGAPWRAVFDVDGDATVQIHVEDPVTPRVARNVCVSGRGRDGWVFNRYRATDSDGNASVRVGGARELVATAYDANWERVASTTFSVDAGRTRSVTLRVEPNALRVRVLDDRDRPVAQASIGIQTAENLAGWYAMANTDDDGRASFSAVGMPSVRVFATDAAHGFVLSPPLDAAAQGEREFVLRFADLHPLRLRALDHDVACSSVQLRVFEPTGGEVCARPTDSSGRMTSDPLALGPYSVVVFSPGYWRTTQSVTHGTTGEPLDIAVRRLGSLRVNAFNSHSIAVSGLAVAIESTEFSRDVADWIADGTVTAECGTTTSLDGGFTLGGLPNGEYRWRVVLATGQILEGLASVPPGSVGEATIVIP